MLGKADATPMIAVKDLDRARKFYEDTLGLEAGRRMRRRFTMRSGDTDQRLSLRVRRDQQGDRADLRGRRHRGEVRELKDKGIFFEHYDFPGSSSRATSMSRRHQDRLVQGPDGNILSLIEGGD